jgi:hypothetical protein
MVALAITPTPQVFISLSGVDSTISGRRHQYQP